MSSFTMFKLENQNVTGQNLIKVEGGKEHFDYLLSNRTRKHNWRDFKVTYRELKDWRIRNVHDIKIDQVLQVALLDGDY